MTSNQKITTDPKDTYLRAPKLPETFRKQGQQTTTTKPVLVTQNTATVMNANTAQKELILKMWVY